MHSDLHLRHVPATGSEFRDHRAGCIDQHAEAFMRGLQHAGQDRGILNWLGPVVARATREMPLFLMRLIQGGKRIREKFRPLAMAARSTSAAESIQSFPSRNCSQARVLILRQLSGTRKLVRAIL